MFPVPRILDRGRLLVALVLVAPIATMVPPVDLSPVGSGAQWAIQQNLPNPISSEPDPADVLANLTNPTVDGSAPPIGAAPPSDEIGSDAADGATGGSTPPSTGGRLPVATSTLTAFPAPSGATHIFPLAGGGTFTNDWGGPRPGDRTHEGIDIFAIAGTPVLAVSDGTLSDVGWSRTGGWRFRLRDRWGNVFYFAHLSAFTPAAQDGASVSAGTVIGFVGNTGDADPAKPMLHFEIHPEGGTPVPPLPYVSAWPRL